MASGLYGKKYGKDLVVDHRDLRYADFRQPLVEAGKIPTIPNPPWGHGNDFLGEAWKMLGNGPDDTVYEGFTGCGDCAWAGPAHEIMELNKNAGRKVPNFTGLVVVEQYGEYSGYDMHSGANDNGSDVREVLQWRATKGYKDAEGGIHKVGIYVALQPKNLTELYEATHLFQCVGIGFEVPETAERQFAEGKPWSVVPGAEIVGGHYVPIMGRPDTGHVAFITWAKRTLMTNQFYTTYNDEAWAYITPEEFSAVTGKDYDGYGPAQLEEYLHAVVKA